VDLQYDRLRCDDVYDAEDEDNESLKVALFHAYVALFHVYAVWISILQIYKHL
jgi:hypothetical protein